jgi:hypothetical protein
MTRSQVAAGTLRARTLELGVAANRVRAASCEYAVTAHMSTNAVNAFVELTQIVARLQEITRAIAAEEIPA